MGGPQVLCDQCLRITIELPANNKLLRTYPDIRTLNDSASSGCALCTMVHVTYEEWRERERRRGSISPDTDGVKHSEIKLLHWMDPRTEFESNIRWQCHLDTRTISLGFTKILGGFFAKPDDLASQHFSGREVRKDPADAEGVALMKRWIQDCVASHPECPSDGDVLLPTRVICIGEPENPQKLCLSIPPHGSTGKYAALSYCWGKTQTYVLTSSTLKRKMEEIEFAKLPKTIQDAVQIARQLDFKYLWVDALCIIQDSKEDWEKESSSMGKVYGNASLTLQATSASDCHEGFLKQREDHSLPPVGLNFKSGDGSPGKVFLRQDPLVREGRREPLVRRGWTLQEALLAPRTISFGPKQMFWECKTSYRSEGGTILQVQGSFFGLPKPILGIQRDDQASSNSSADLVVEKRRTWAFIFREYSPRQLTYPKDKLPALSGLANVISNTRPGDTYLAGLWRGDLPQSLLWACIDKPSKPSAYRAPSWSWASLDCGIAISEGYQEPGSTCCEVLNAWTTPSGLDPFGEVKDGMITLRGPVKEGWRNLDKSARDGDPGVQFFFEQRKAFEAFSDAFNAKLGMCELDIFDPAQPLNEPISTTFLQITKEEGLILKPLQDGKFRRIGSFQLDDGKHGWFGETDRRTIDII